MAGFVPDESDQLPVLTVSSLGTCTSHPQFETDILCRECQVRICLVCYSISHKDHTIEAKLCVREDQKPRSREDSETKKRRIEHLQGDLETRRKKIKCLKQDCEELDQGVEETVAQRELCLERRRDELEADKRDFKRRIKSIKERLEKEDDDIYALQYSTEKAMSSSDGYDEIDGLETKIEARVRLGLPREESLTELRVTVERFKSASWTASCSSRFDSTPELREPSEEFITFTAGRTTRCECLQHPSTDDGEPMETGSVGDNPGTSTAVTSPNPVQEVCPRPIRNPGPSTSTLQPKRNALTNWAI